jgi:hypothetical protein
MAAEPLSIPRRALLGAAASLPVVALAPPPVIARSEATRQSTRVARTFARRLARYRRFAARARHAAETGFLRAANLRYGRERAEVEARFGSWEAAAATPEGRKLRRSAFRRVSRAEDAFYRGCAAPLHRAAILLAQTPAPDPRALLEKIALIQAHKLHEEGIMPRCALDVLAEDVGRLARRA